jgi:hypothetical protein
MENATQLVHGTPKLAASQRTYIRQPFVLQRPQFHNLISMTSNSMDPFGEIGYLSCMTGLLDEV